MGAVIESLKALIDSYIVAISVLLVALVYGVWKLALKYKEKEGRFNKTIEKLPCADHGNLLHVHTDQINSSRAQLDKMSGQLDLLVKLSSAIRTKPLLMAENEYSEKHSPRRLNKNGETLYSDIEGETFLNDNIRHFSSEIDKLEPKTALDVENSALAVLRIYTASDIFIPIKSWVYNAPAREIVRPDGTKVMTEVSLDDVLFVLSLPLRDMYLKSHPNIIQ